MTCDGQPEKLWFCVADHLDDIVVVISRRTVCLENIYGGAVIL